VFTIVIALLLAGCDYRQPGMSSADIQEFAASHPGITQTCLDDVRWGRRSWGDVVDDSDCFEMQPAQRWTGLWEIGWEWTNFCPDPTTKCDWMSGHGTWLTFAKDAYHDPVLPDGTYRIDFVGRRTKVPGYFGHQGEYEHLMVVDHVISIQKIPGEKYTNRF
jgi:hypothetical protein